MIPNDIDEITKPLRKWVEDHGVYLVSRGRRVDIPRHNQAYVYDSRTNKLQGAVRYTRDKWTFYRKLTEKEILELRDAFAKGLIDITGLSDITFKL